MKEIKAELEKRYEDLFEKYNLERPLDSKNISLIIKRSLCKFLENCKKPAVYCGGGHTKMLMADFIYELKKVRYIVDNYAKPEADSGFILIRDEEIETEGIDAVILSSYKFRRDLKEKLRENHPGLPVLDIYDEFEKNGVAVKAEYYYSNHPYQHYKRINQLQREIREEGRGQARKELYKNLVTKYLHIKDFRTALMKLDEWISLEGITKEEQMTARRLSADLESLYNMEKEAAASLPEDHVLLFCMDGLRRQDLSETDMPKLKKMLDETGYQFTNAYSLSTSTFESLVPAYSENCDLRTRYYEKNYVNLEDCRFASLAKKQNREIYIYGDVEHFIEGEGIHYSGQFLTVTEKLWQFILDAHETEWGLFYIHELYESHFTFSNPYTKAPLMSEGTAMLFDFLPMKGGRLRADYAGQHKDAIHYLDDVAGPLLCPMKCRMAVYADHGTLILDYDTKLPDIGDMEYVCSEGWIRIPLAIRSKEMGVGKDETLTSLFSFNDIVISMLEKKPYAALDNLFIKVARSKLYNPDFRYLYQEIGKEKYLLAFEAFVFAEGYKLVVYGDGTAALYRICDDKEYKDSGLMEELLERIRPQITVCDGEHVKTGE